MKKVIQRVIKLVNKSQFDWYFFLTQYQLKNLSERGSSIQTSERKERLLYRAMDRSRRVTNPQNYNDDGTVKKGRKTWRYSMK